MQTSLFSSSYLTEAAQDLRVAMRRMHRAPALAAAIVLTIGLGLGAAAAIFTTSEATLIEPLPYADPGRLVHLWELRAGTEERSPTSYPTLLDWRTRASGFSALEGYDPTNVTVGIGDESQPLRGARVTVGFFRLLGVRIPAGRDFLQGEDATGGPGVAIVSEHFARSDAARTGLDRTIVINGAPYVIVGVLPHGFHFALLQNADVFVPLAPGAQTTAGRSNRSIHVIGRLRNDVPLARARAELTAVMSALASEYPDALGGRTVVAVPLRDALLGNMKLIVTSLLVVVAFLLVIMGVNLALLMLTRYVARAGELAMRSALGATRHRILRQLLVETLVPSLVGAALAIAIGQLTTRALLAAIPDGLRAGMPYLTNAGLDGRVIAVIVGVAIAMAVGFGLGPALLVTRVWGRAGDVRTTLARGDRRLRRGLVAAQMALAVVLLVSSGLLVMSFANLVHRDVGFRDPERLATVRVPLSGPRYADPIAQQQFYEALLARSAELPGVREVSVINEVPGGGGGITTFEPVDRPRSRASRPRAALRIVGGEYFSTMGVPTVAGRAFEPPDRSDAPPVAVVSASLARLLADEGATVGRRLRLDATGETEWEVVGVVGDVQVAALDADTPPVVYLSHLQLAENRMTLVLRTNDGVASVAGRIRAIVSSLDPGVPVHPVARLDHQLSESRAIFSRRFPMILCGVFAASALALTLVALYAVCAHEVVTRRREFGIRLALGSSPATIRRSILSDVSLLGAVGIGIGAIVASAVSRSMQAVLFGIAPTDWRVYGVVAAGVFGSALVAALGPAVRAGAVNPSVVLRAE
jgi:predicted permease